MNNNLSRRTFLTWLASLSPTLAGIPLPRSNPHYAPIRRYTAPYLEWMERPYAAPLNELFSAVVGDHTIGLIFYDLTNKVLISALQPEMALPIASAFKAPLAMYFFHTVDPAVWLSVPVEYWNSNQANEVPLDYRPAWTQHRYIFKDLYQMMTISDNPATGRVLAYIADRVGSDRPMVGFNDWSHNVVGLSQLSGLSDWYFGIPNRMDPTDFRFGGQGAVIDHQTWRYSNLFTPRDMGLYYTWFLDEMTDEQQLVCGTLLNQVYANRRSNIEDLALYTNGMAFSKNGTLGTDTSPAGIVITDAGIIQHGNGTAYLAVMLSANAVEQVPPVFDVMNQVLQGVYEGFIEEAAQSRALDIQVTDDYAQHIQQNYSEAVTLSYQNYNYGFIKTAGMPLYTYPDEAYAVRNPVISSSRFGVHLLMQGALVRFMPLNDEWVQLIPDDQADVIRQRLADDIYVHLADLQPVSPHYFEPIPYFIDSLIRPDQKMIVVDIQQRQLSVVEGANVVFKTPIALSNLATPRGSYPIITKWLCRSMQAWAPGVPFTSFFHTEGYAIHGSPWQRWSETVTQSNLWGRISAGCVNVPNWTLDMGYYVRPVDELIFRWVGGVHEAGYKVYEYPDSAYNQIRVFVVDYLQDLHGHSLPRPIAQLGVNWYQMIANIDYIPLSAPPSFFA